MDEEWKKTWAAIERMRKQQDAPVDRWGCDQLYQRTASPRDQRFQILVSLLLSSQTKDEVTAAATHRLFLHAATAKQASKMEEAELARLIHPVGFYKRKAAYLKRLSLKLVEEYEGDIPQEVEKLCALPGIGPKMAHLAMNAAWGRCEGIGVDLHVHRICARLGWTSSSSNNNAMTPEDTRKQLQSWLPKEYWPKINHLLVGFGQTVCTARNPKCHTCLARPYCPFGRK